VLVEGKIEETLDTTRIRDNGNSKWIR